MFWFSSTNLFFQFLNVDQRRMHIIKAVSCLFFGNVRQLNQTLVTDCTSGQSTKLTVFWSSAAFPLLCFLIRTGRRSLTQGIIKNITTWGPDGERQRLTSNTPRYLRHRLIAAVTRTSRPVSAAFKQNSEADERRMKSRLCVTGPPLPLLADLGCSGFLPQPP